jgi:hypothetical protein
MTAPTLLMTLLLACDGAETTTEAETEAETEVEAPAAEYDLTMPEVEYTLNP